MTSILYCQTCHNYTLKTTCSHCNQKTISRKPARFSPQDPYGEYRRKLKKLQKKG